MSWLHDLDALRAWSHHPDARVRRWAVARWLSHHPAADLIGLGRLLLDPDPELRADVAMHLAQTGDARWGPVLTKALELVPPEGRRDVIAALGAVKDPRVVPVLTDALRKTRDPAELVELVQALAQHRAEGAWRALIRLLDAVTQDDAMARKLVGGVLGMGRRDDVPNVVAHWRRWTPTDQPETAEAITTWLGADAELRQRCGRLGRLKPSHVIALVRRHRGLTLPDGAVDALDAAHAQGPRAFARAAHATAIRLLVQRQHNLRAWLDAPLGRPLEDYRALAVGAEALLGALAAGTPHPDRELAEPQLALAALLQLAAGDDAVATLHAEPSAVWRLLASPATCDADAVHALVRKVGGRAARPLAELLAADVPDKVLEAAIRLARALPPSHAGPVLGPLAHLAQHRSGGLVAATAASALVHLGPESVAALVGYLHDPSDEVVEALGRLDTQACFDALAGQLRASVAPDLRLAVALVDTGHPGALDVLLPMWTPGDELLGELLDASYVLHDRQTADGAPPPWRPPVAEA